MIVAQVNLFYAVTPDLEIHPHPTVPLFSIPYISDVICTVQDTG